LAGLPAAVAAAREELVAFRDERGRELLDLPDAPRPDPDTPAPVRFLPAFDNAILGYHDRSRIIGDTHRGLSVAGARVVLVDGRVAATWSAEAGAGGGTETVVVTPLRGFSRAERTSVAEQGLELASFLSDGESHRVRIADSGP
ncbi:DNA glycosylase AlkZ-like family protein, partial [Streptomonospora algeriensis]